MTDQSLQLLTKDVSTPGAHAVILNAMLRGFLLTALTLLASLPGAAQDTTPSPTLEGIVTAITASDTFDINGKHIVLSNTTASHKQPSGESILERNCSTANLYLGEHIQVIGKRDSKTHSVLATRLNLPTDAAPGILSANGIVDAIYPAAAPNFLLRAAGYKVLVTPKTAVTSLPPLTAVPPIHANMWAVFRGTQQPDGTIAADTLILAENTLSKNVKKLIDKTEYDPASIDPETGQTLFSRSTLGIDPRKVPPYEDHAMQARVSAIGEKLIPHYQRDLPTSDPTRINFRFQLVDRGSWRQPLTLGSGITLIPFQLVERMQSDAQLAAILSYSIAMVLERQAVDTQVSVAALTASAGVATAGILVPPVGAALLAYDAVSVPFAIHGIHLLKLQEQERLRVSLDLLNDAGYDIDQAPIAWWLLDSKKKDIHQISIPQQSTYLYQVLGSLWHIHPVHWVEPGQ